MRFFQHHSANKLRADQQRTQCSLISPKVVKTFYNSMKGSTRALSPTQLFLHNRRRPRKSFLVEICRARGQKIPQAEIPAWISLYFPEHRFRNRTNELALRSRLVKTQVWFISQKWSCLSDAAVALHQSIIYET